MIQLNSLADIRSLKESVSLECKKAAGRTGAGKLPSNFWETYSAMANTNGGTVLLGIEEKAGEFKLVGIKQVEKIRQDLFNLANSRSKVSVNLLTDKHVQTSVVDGMSVVQIEIRRAHRQERPVFLKGNPLGNTFIRRHESDQKLCDEAVKRMLAEQIEDCRDERLLKDYGLDDLCNESLSAYRQAYSLRDPDNPWNELQTLPFLEKIKGWRKDRETGDSGLTAAGLLMFGQFTSIQEVFTHYMLDYQEHAEANTDGRWIDRLTLDGKWSGNLYTFYRKVYSKLTEDLKVPFQLTGDQRVDASPIHVAIREALCNLLVHADYSDRASVKVVKSPGVFCFRNPGMMRIPVKDALQGGNADCRNRRLHQMFRHAGIGEQSGSGIPRILKSWNQYHWQRPELVDTREPFDQTIICMRMHGPFSHTRAEQLRQRYGSLYDKLPYNEQIALAIVAKENTVTHQLLLKYLPAIHSSDASQCLQSLVGQRLLEQTGTARGAVYHLTGHQIPGPEDIFDLPSLGQNPSNLNQSPSNLNQSSPNLNQSPSNLNQSPSNLNQSPSNLNQSPLEFEPELPEYQTRCSGKTYLRKPLTAIRGESTRTASRTSRIA